MSLLDKYNTAGATTNAGLARTTQNRGVAGTGVDRMDAGLKSSTAADTMQSNFTKNAAGTTTFTRGTDTSYTSNELKGLSRWYGRALNFAFSDPNASGNYIQKSLHTTFKTLRTDGGTKEVWSDNTAGGWHRWTPSGKFNASFETAPIIKNRAQSKTLPTPTSAPAASA